MNSDTDILDELFHKNARIELIEHYDKFKAILDEPQCPESKAVIFGIPKDSLIIKVDMFKSPDAIFCGSKDECKRSDYIIISESKKCVIFIELKKSGSPWHHIVKQLTGATCFFGYCEHIGRLFWDKTDFLKGYKKRYVSICHTSVTKKPMKSEKKVGNAHDAPHKAIKISHPSSIQFNMLAGLNA